jgi:hypothetical protein
MLRALQMVGCDVCPELEDVDDLLGQNQLHRIHHLLPIEAWKLSPSMVAALAPTRRKICSRAALTAPIPAPDEPVTAMIGCFFDILFPILLQIPNLSTSASVTPQARVRANKPNDGFL